MTIPKVLKSLGRFADDCWAASRVAGGVGSLAGLVAGLVHLRLASRLYLTDNRAMLRSRLEPRVTVAFRRNLGDLLSLTEVWLRECYRLPFPILAGTLVDLGANIGLTSLWLTARYGFRDVLAVEPDPTNAALAQRNFAANGVRGRVIQAAVGAVDRTAHFRPHAESNRGSLAVSGNPVQVHSMATLLRMLPVGERVSLLKIDIEGGEQELFTGDLGWLAAVDAIIIEFHPEIVEYERLIGNVERAGFRLIRHDSAWPGNMDCFVRVGAVQ
jgi:FkbM family methyltransferase